VITAMAMAMPRTGTVLCPAQDGTERRLCSFMLSRLLRYIWTPLASARSVSLAADARQGRVEMADQMV